MSSSVPQQGITKQGNTLFISDLHLSETSTRLNDAFFAFLKEHQGVDALYVLGDLFAYWLGDDCMNDFHQQIIEAFAEFSQHSQLFFMHGNRDYLLGKQFAQACGGEIIKEYSYINLYGRHTLLLHGDSLCTLDKGYQNLRLYLRHPLILKLADNLPACIKRAVAKSLSRKVDSNQANQIQYDKPEWDVEESTVLKTFELYQVDTMIHGHTHKPKQHQYTLGNHTVSRLVLGDWGKQDSLWWIQSDIKNIYLESKVL